MDDATKLLEQRLVEWIAACNNCFDQCLLEDNVKIVVCCPRSLKICRSYPLSA
ncbi:hypothetical protein LZ578_03060 [Jeotgalibaca sp. MA1X17-3]|uniref:hypothetical protein n=1 Tax=Jeotgalibaca sp. MA1X17-3 TaxID=2908211 RepID=UPI001F18E5AB|nr:hypothetical protein [Jeotgalibaca sp. MA1X17-3]UJF16129.1 hypothetical protein LZ578_03060 [Jeotgalibaca sp. MA1X17-3]